jgi:hypothetical protein
LGNANAAGVLAAGRLITTDVGRSRCSVADRLATKDSDLPATTEDRAQAASDAAATATANSRTAVRTAAAETHAEALADTLADTLGESR